MPRRRGRDRYRGGKKVPAPTELERRVAELERQAAIEGRTIGPPPIGRTARGTEPPVHVDPPPAWCVRGAKVDYCAVIGGEPTLFNVAVTADPFMVKGAGYVTFIEKIRGWVAISALRPAGKDS